MKIAIIGGGNMGGATAIGLVKAGVRGISVTTRHESSLEKFKGYDIGTGVDNAAAAEGADIVILVVKPWLMEGVVKELKTTLNLDKQLVVSMTTGVVPEQYQQWLGEDLQLAYVIPNIAIETGESMTFISNVSATEEQLKQLDTLFSKVGTVLTVPFDRLSAGTALASCGIAYALRYIRAASEGGVQLGFFAKDAAKIVAQTAKGAASLLEAHNSHPEAEIDKVTTPGGITIKGLNAMEEAGFTNAVIRGLLASR